MARGNKFRWLSHHKSEAPHTHWASTMENPPSFSVKQLLGWEGEAQFKLLSQTGSAQDVALPRMRIRNTTSDTAHVKWLIKSVAMPGP